MALARKCDRCGNIYEHYPSTRNSIKYVRVSSNGFDLCPRCLESFNAWLKMEFEPVFVIKDADKEDNNDFGRTES